jgi:hypothetical protein
MVDGARSIMAALVDANVAVIGFDLERGRLNEAFLELTAPR